MSTPTPETFTDAQINDALEQFLKWGEQTYAPDESEPSVSGHKGYYSGIGFPARALRYLLAQRQPSPFPPDNYLASTPDEPACPTKAVAELRRCVKLGRDIRKLVESRSGGQYERIQESGDSVRLLYPEGYVRVVLALTFKDKQSDFHKPIPEPVPEIPTTTTEPPAPDNTDEADLQAAQDLDAGRVVDGMVVKWARPKIQHPNTWEVRLVYVESGVFMDVDNRDLHVALRICRTLLKARLKRNAAYSATQNASTSKT